MARPLRSLRILRRHWKLTAIAVFSLSVAMALGVVSLSILNTFLILPPSGPEPDRLVNVYSRTPSTAIDQISFPDYQFYRQNNHIFTDLAGAPNSLSLLVDQSGGREIKLSARPVSGNYLAVLGIKPLLGRFLSQADDESNSPVAVMTWSCWKRLGSDPKIIGRAIAGYTIIGIAPKDFTGSFFGANGDILVSLGRDNFTPASRANRDERRLFLIGRLKPGITRRQAQAEMAALSARLANAYPKADKNRTAVVARATLLPPDAMPDAQLIAGILMAVIILVLLIACGNVANLLLAVAVGRRQEASIKLALGAPRGRLIREFIGESALLCVVSGLIGYAVAAVVIARYSNLEVNLPTFGAFSVALNLRLDLTVAGFTLALMILATLATGVSPALYASSPNLAQILSGEIVVGGRRKVARRNALLIVQVAICTLVLIGTGLCEQSLYNLRRVDPGFSARNLIAIQVYPSRVNGYSEKRGKEFYETVRQKVAALPGVEAVSLVAGLPLLGSIPEPVQVPDSSNKITVSHSVVDADFFSTFGIRLLSGRVFSSIDREGSPLTVVANQKLANTFWPGQSALGKTLMIGEPARKATVIGTVADGKYDELDEPPTPFLYYALSQHYQESLNLVARTARDPHMWEQPLTRVLREMDHPAPLPPYTFDSWLNLTLLTERIAAACIAALSALGLLLAVIGLFGAVAWSVSERKKELGIRAALGARPAHLLRMVLRQTLSVASVGVGAGVVLGIAATALLRSQLYGIGAIEWPVLLGVGATMLSISALVAWLSARPWIRISPMEAVRHA